MDGAGGKPPGKRERNRQETHERIVTVGLKLFVEKGFEETTLDEIAQAAGIARRTLFSYFESKDDILSSSYGSGFSQALGPAMREGVTGALVVTRGSFPRLVRELRDIWLAAGPEGKTPAGWEDRCVV